MEQTQSKRQVAKAAGIVMSAILISRILGFVRERAVAEVLAVPGQQMSSSPPLPCPI